VPVVLGPAADGGYWLMGQRSPGLDLFSDVPWSSPETLSATRARLSALRASHEELPVLGDLDTVADLHAILASGDLQEELHRRIQSAVSRARWRA
jgi:glycosyltransferase A (GT-A) superfamily protein (DUF2064 family)